MDDLIATLRRKGYVEVDEHLIEYAGEWMRIEKGDRYLGQHGDQKPELLTCRRREVQRRGSGRVLGKFFPKERKDSQGNTPRLYTLNEVIKVVIRENPNYDATKKEKIHERNPLAAIASVPDPAAGLESPGVQWNDGDVEGTPAVRGDDREAAAADDRSGQREDGNRAGEAPRAAVPKPGPRPGPKPPKRGAEHRDPRQPGGRTDYSAASRKSDD